MHTYAKNELALKILYALSVGLMIPAAFVAPNVPKAMAPLLRKLAKQLEAQPRVIHRSLLALKRKKLLIFEERNGEVMALVSVDGKKRLAKGKLNELCIQNPKKWDGKYRIVIFDIPEKQKASRDALRGVLRKLGFLQIQKSCFAHPFECRDEIDLVSSVFGVTQHITYIVAQSFEGEMSVREHFRL